MVTINVPVDIMVYGKSSTKKKLINSVVSKESQKNTNVYTRDNEGVKYLGKCKKLIPVNSTVTFCTWEDKLSDDVDNVIISNSEYNWRVGDNYKEFSPKAGSSFCIISRDCGGITESDMLWMCIDLSYSYGSKLDFYNGEKGKEYYISGDIGIIKCIERDIENIKKYYNVDITVVQKCGKKTNQVEFDW